MSSTKSSMLSTSPNAECTGGLRQSWPSGTRRMLAISGVTFAAGSTPP
jgi:hypothetical protein